MEYELSLLAIDAVPQHSPMLIVENVCTKDRNMFLNSFLDDFTLTEFKSMFFLLMDYIEKDQFFEFTKQEKCHLKQKFIEIYGKFNNECILIELLGTMKMYKRLRRLNTCRHLYKIHKDRKFNQIDDLWKMLYLICEELSDNDLKLLKQNIPNNFKGQILVAEDWFYWAFQQKIFSKTDLSNLVTIFKNYPICLNILQNFKAKQKLYEIKTPSTDFHCGIALIINYDTFNNPLLFGKREGSVKDVHSLKNLWDVFGFKTIILTNLTSYQTLNQLRKYAILNHSTYDAFVCCILSHGKSNSIISSDCEEMQIPHLIAQITNYSTTLASKPKLFFIQACQGTNVQQGVGKSVYYLKPPETSKSVMYNSEVPPIASDVLIATSTIDGYVSFRTEHGSWFIQTLCTSMMQSGDKSSILDVMTEVNHEVRQLSADFGVGGPRNAQQIVNCLNTLEKTLILKKRIS